MQKLHNNQSVYQKDCDVVVAQLSARMTKPSQANDGEENGGENKYVNTCNRESMALASVRELSSSTENVRSEARKCERLTAVRLLERALCGASSRGGKRKIFLGQKRPKDNVVRIIGWMMSEIEFKTPLTGT